MSRRLRLCCLIIAIAVWSGVLLTPKLRLILRSQIVSLRPHTFYKEAYLTDLSNIVASHPNDPRVIIQNAEAVASKRDYLRQKLEESSSEVRTAIINNPQSAISVGSSNIEKDRKEILRLYDRLITQHPQKAWLIKNRLRLSTFGAIQINDDKTKESNSYPSPTWLNKAELHQAIEIAHRGMRLEPQNSFYNWICAIFLFSLKDNAAALRTLHDGSLKQSFDDGTLQDVQNRIAVHQMQRSLLWEERFVIAMSEVLPHLSYIRKVNRVAVGIGEDAERNSNNAKALQIYESQWKLGISMIQNSDFSVTTAVGQAIVFKAWSGLGRWPKNSGNISSKRSTSQRAHLIASRFADYASRNGRADLARETMRDVKLALPLINFNEAPVYLYELPRGHDVREIIRWKWFGNILLGALFWCTTLWIAIIAFQQLIARWRKPKPEIAANFHSDLDVISAAIFVTLCLSTALIFARQLWDLQIIGQLFLIGDIGNSSFDPTTTHLIKIIKLQKQWLPFVPLLLIGLYCVPASMWRRRKETKTTSNSGCIISFLVFGVASIGLGILVLYLTRLAGELSLDSDAVKSWLPLLSPALAVVAFQLYLMIRFGKLWIKGLGRALFLPNTSQLFRQTLLLMMVVLSCTYLFTSLASLPIRSEANARFDIFLRHGDMALRQARQK